jgi:protoporphyrinogen/coproporphyrinogen III oxidase
MNLGDPLSPHSPACAGHPPSVRRIAVLGGGITGLSAAYFLAQARRQGAPIEELLIEGRDRLGGSIQTERVEGFLIEGGPDSFITEKPEAEALCRALGLGDSLLGSNDAGRRTYILHRGRLVPLPDGLMLLVPTRIWPMLTTPLVPLRGKLAMVAEVFTKPPGAGNGAADDESVASFVGRHFGDAMTQNIADPLLSGVFGGDSAALSIRSVLPRFYDMEQEYGSLTRATLKAMRQRRARAKANPASNAVEAAPTLFMTLRDGMGRMVEALKQRLDLSQLFLGQSVLAIEPYEGGAGGRAYRMRCEGGVVHNADAVIMTLPAYQCSRLASAFDSSLAQPLESIPYNSAMTVSMGYGKNVLEQLRPGFGFLVPRKEGRRLLACTFVHGKFNHRAPPGGALLRCFLGGSRDPGALHLSDHDAVELCRRELGSILNLDAEPSFYRIYRWPQSMPQYEVGHSERVDAILRRLQNHPGLFVAGNAYSGIGISDCIRTAKTAAERALSFLSAF